MLLKLVELRSSDWGRVHASAASNATPENDPNYFMVCDMCYLLFSCYHLQSVYFSLVFIVFFVHRMNLLSTQKMGHRLLQQTQVRKCNTFLGHQDRATWGLHTTTCILSSEVTVPTKRLD